MTFCVAHQPAFAVLHPSCLFHATADDKVEDLTLVGWDSKRDRWNGYDAKDYVKVVDRFETMDNIRKEMKKKEQVGGGWSTRSFNICNHSKRVLLKTTYGCVRATNACF